jgi:predicted dinucleotide-binding enzyme
MGAKQTISSRLLAGLGVLIFASIALQPQVRADTIAIIGTGNVGAALGPEFAAQGHTIIYGSREPTRDDVVALVRRTGNNASAISPRDAVAGADMVVLAVPGTAAEAIVQTLGDLSGKIILDPTNRVGRGGDYLTHDVPGKGSNAELIQAAAPGARVVKAFNTLNWQQMVDPESAGGAISIPLAGDDAEAKAVIARLVEGMGLHAIDIGPLAYAHVLEELLVVWGNALGQGTPYNYYLRPMPAN